MFCVQCGKQIPESAKFCPSCGAAAGGTVEGAPPRETPETIIMQGGGQIIKSAVFANSGNVVLTNKRIIFNRGGNVVMGHVLTGGKFLFDIPLKEVVRVEESKKGVARTILVERENGEVVHFGFLKPTPWLVAIQSAVGEAR